MNDDLQRTEDWHLQRAGKFTGSVFADLMARGKKDGKPLKAWHDMVWRVATERITGVPTDSINAAALRWGTEVEPFALDAYQLQTGAILEQAGFIVHPEFAFAGVSPDGLIGADGGVEAKSPKNSQIHLQRWMDGMEEDHLPQVQGAMWVTGRAWWDFISYDPRAPEHLRLYVQRVQRDEAYIATLQASVLEAEAAAVDLIAKINAKVAA